VITGLALAAVLAVEIYLAIAKAMLASGRVVLGLGLMLDAGARGLGTLAAERAGRPAWAWGCVIGGGPVVAIFSLYRPGGPEPVRPAPLAGLMALAAGAVILLALVLGG
jgi:hypothetical protein